MNDRTGSRPSTLVPRPTPDRWFIRKDGTDARLDAKRLKPQSFGGAPDSPIPPLPRAAWPMWAEFIATLAAHEDSGVGDTFKRKLGLAGALFARAAEAMGVPCYCPERCEEWNARFPYE